jgi:DNA-directed RNA polymerase specialized sigma24 family protein
MSDDSISLWVAQLQTGDEQAAQRVFESYFERLVRLARGKLIDGQRRAADEEDVALSALDSFFRGTARGRFPKLNDRDDLWNLLLVITSRKAADYVNSERALKRGGGLVCGESAFLDVRKDGLPRGIDQNATPEPSPQFAAEITEVCETLFDMLDTPQLKRVAILRMEGFNDSEIAEQLSCTRSTVQRRLQLIRRIWARGIQ